ncbi:hypothetical protein PHLCEN_2v4092 [Hermanssonia centrifuga]|uniref:Uncharacterized protein n=1 Tax=Hermanssonia centrifuga TaxID=98765 RepID=A0A2R6Q293_9APHY|nr:hypothetical protein PHLCEN_2v4092 [Hermanssonia centrifuga]
MNAPRPFKDGCPSQEIRELTRLNADESWAVIVGTIDLSFNLLARAVMSGMPIYMTDLPLRSYVFDYLQ